MIEHVIVYEDYNGNQCTEKANFHLNKQELTEMELSIDGGLSNYYQKIVDAENVPELAKVFKELILKSYGIKSDDGKKFIKIAQDGHRLADDFMQSAAFEALYMELITDEDKAVKFFNGIVPKFDNLPKTGSK